MRRDTEKKHAVRDRPSAGARRAFALGRALSVALCGCAMAAVLCGCAPTATFVSVEPPPGASVEARFESDPSSVRKALLHAMRDAGLVTNGDGAGGLSGSKQQVPFVGRGATEPAPGALPEYHVRVHLTGDAGTHVRATVEVVCPVCDGATPYEWEYPSDLLRDVIGGARDVLGERGGSVDYPSRHRPERWRPEGEQGGA